MAQWIRLVQPEWMPIFFHRREAGVAGQVQAGGVRIIFLLQNAQL